MIRHNRGCLYPHSIGNLCVPGFLFPQHLQDLEDLLLRLAGPTLHRVILTLPLRHGKTWYVILFLAWLLRLRPTMRILFVSYSQDFADLQGMFLRQLLTRFSGTCNLQNQRFQLDPASRGKSEIRTTAGGFFKAYGLTSAIGGETADWVVGDDLLVDIEAITSAERRDHAFHLWNNFCGRVSPTGPTKLLMIGSRRHPQDVIGQTLAINDDLPAERRWTYHCYPAINAEGRALWPEIWPISRLEATQQELELKGEGWRFANEYMNDPQGDPSLCEFSVYVGRPEDTARYFYTELPAVVPKFRMLTLDSSLGARKGGDYTALLYIVFAANGHVYVDDCWMKQCTSEEAEDAAVEYLLKYNPDAFVCDTTLFQDVILRNIIAKAQARGAPYPGHKAFKYNSTSQDSKKFRIRISLTPLLAQQTLHVRDIRANRIGWNQVQSFSSGHDDWPDALSIGIQLMAKLLGKRK